MKSIFDISDLISEDLFEDCNNYLIKYIGTYVKKGISPLRYEVFEVSCSFDGILDFWSRPIRFISHSESHLRLADILSNKGKKVFLENLTSHIGEGKKLLYRDLKDLPRLKLKSNEDEQETNNFTY